MGAENSHSSPATQVTGGPLGAPSFLVTSQNWVLSQTKFTKLLRLTFGYSKVMFINLLQLLVGTTLLALPSFHQQHPQPS